jgi:hypothetical protein
LARALNVPNSLRLEIPMKAFLMILVAFGISAGAEASTRCRTGYASIPGGSIQLHCTNGSCSGWLSAQSIYVSESCDAGLTYSASGSTPSDSVYGTCRNGNFSAWLSTSTIYLSGSCSDGGSFSGDVTRNSQSIFGRCDEDGYSTLWVSSQSGYVNGSCH